MMKRFILSLALFAVFVGSFAAADFLDATFWSSSPTDNQIETALFATDSSYTENWTWYNSACNISSVIYLTEGTDVLPNTWASNTIYVLDAGIYTTSYQVNLSDCSAIVGNGDVTLQSSEQLTSTFFGSGTQNIILDNIKIDWSTQHDTLKNTYGLWIQWGSSNITLNRIESYRQWSIWIYFKQSSYIYIYNSKFFENTSIGLYFESITQSSINDSEAYQNNGTSTNLHWWFILNASSYVLLRNLISHDNYRMNISLYSSTYCIVDGAKLYNSPYRSLFISFWSNNTVKNSYIYNNYVWLYIYKSTNNMLNNINIFNHYWQWWLVLWYYWNTAINNCNIFNNANGIYAWWDTNNMLNNINIFNNRHGIFLEDSWDNNFRNNINIYNNLTWVNFDYYWNITKNAPSLGNKYFGNFSLFNNQFINIGGIDSYISTGLIISWSTYDGVELLVWWTNELTSLGMTNWVFNTTNIFDTTWLIEPINSSWISLFDWMPLDKIWFNTWRIATENIDYVYGKSISKQSQPVYYNWSDYIFSPLSWNYSVYIGKTWDPDFYFIDKYYLTWFSATSSFNTNDSTFIGEQDLDVGLFSFGTFNKDVILQSTWTNKIETFINSGVFFKQNDGTTDYAGLLKAPLELDKDTASELKWHRLPSVIKIGADNQTIRFKNSWGSDTTVIVRIPVPGITIWTPLEIFYSADGNSWNTLTSTNVVDINGDPYAEFTTTHFTYFAISWGTWSFVINNDDTSVSFSGVTLSLDASGSQNMRFSNDGSWRSTWESYATSKEWFLEDIPGTKTVYVEFDLNGDLIGDISTFDTIYLLDVQQWQLTLEILTWTSECVYGTSLNLSWQDVKLNEWYTFTGSFSGQWYCADYVGVSDGWALTIQVSDLTNAGWNIISGSNIFISHGWATTQWDSACTGSDGTPNQFSSAPYTLIEKSSWSDKICKVTLDNVNLEVNVPAFQAPGNYNGTLTLTVPNF